MNWQDDQFPDISPKAFPTASRSDLASGRFRQPIHQRPAWFGGPEQAQRRHEQADLLSNLPRAALRRLWHHPAYAHRARLLSTYKRRRPRFSSEVTILSPLPQVGGRNAGAGDSPAPHRQAKRRAQTTSSPSGITALSYAQCQQKERELSAVLVQWMQQWPDLTPYLRLIPTPIPWTVGPCHTREVAVPIILWMSHRPIGRPQEERVAFLLARFWKDGSQDWKNWITFRMGLHQPTLSAYGNPPPQTGGQSPARGSGRPQSLDALTMDEPTPLAYFINAGQMVVQWVVWTPDAGWQVGPLYHNGVLVQRPSLDQLHQRLVSLLHHPVSDLSDEDWGGGRTAPGLGMTLTVTVLSFLAAGWWHAWLPFSWILPAFTFVAHWWAPRWLQHSNYRRWRRWLADIAHL